MKRPNAFTLIELLIVIGIISILASIALVNMQEAQTRAKVARAQADMRSIATAIEAYAVDHSRYPPNTALGFIDLFTGRSSLVLTETHVTRSPNVVPTNITTPIAYITGRPAQPFQVKPYDTPFDPHITYIYYRKYSYNEWEEAAQNGILMPLIPKVDDFFECQFGQWVMWSTGPDLIDWYGNWEDFKDPINPGSDLKCPAHGPWSFSFHVPYDPTNGSTSFGNIFRSHNLEMKACVCGQDEAGCCKPCDDNSLQNIDVRSKSTGDSKDLSFSSLETDTEDLNDAVNWNAFDGDNGKGGGGGAGWEEPILLAQAGRPAQPTSTPIRSLEDYLATQPDESEIAFPDFKKKHQLSTTEKLAAFLATMGVALVALYVVLKWRQRRLIEEDDLGLGNVAVTDNVLQHIPGLTKRKSLDLSGTTITDSGAAQLATLTNLEELNLSRTLVGDEGVKHIATLPALHTLNLAHSMITDAGVAHLKGKLNLRVLVLNDTKITAAAMDSLLTLGGLRYLNLSNTAITGDEAARLRAQLSFCEVLAGAVTPDIPDDQLLDLHAQTGPFTSNSSASNAATGREK